MGTKINSFENVDSIIKLYTRIPEYSEVQHLGTSEFINKIEKLKEEFREIRSNLNEDSSDVEELIATTKKSLNIEPETSYNERFHKNEENHEFLNIRSLKISNYKELEPKYYNNANENLKKYKNSALNYRKSCTDLIKYKEIQDQDDEDENLTNSYSSSESNLNLYLRRKEEFVPPSNVQKRIFVRKAQKLNLAQKSNAQQNETGPNKTFKAHPIPAHVFKPMYEKFINKNKKRSQKVKEQSKEKLLSQMKPFSFSKPVEVTKKSIKFFNNSSKRSQTTRNYIKNNLKLANNAPNLIKRETFRANAAPPPSRALMSALRLKEQQEYRELKKTLRAEALLKMASLPPRMATRDLERKKNEIRMNSILSQLEKNDKSFNYNNKKDNWDSNSSVSNILTDDDRFSEDSIFNENVTFGKVRENKDENNRRGESSFTRLLKDSNKRGFFESTANDNHASRLRIKATREKEEMRIQREEAEQLKLLLNEAKRNKLRSSHLDVWKNAVSYSSNQDIALRRQLRLAASIVERECFRTEMQNMLQRVRSAPLLLQGVRERKFEPCKKHKEEMSGSNKKINLSNNSALKTGFGFGGDKYFSRVNWTSHGDENLKTKDLTSLDAAIAEGSLTNSDNESLKSDGNKNRSLSSNEAQNNKKSSHQASEIEDETEDCEKNESESEE